MNTAPSQVVQLPAFAQPVAAGVWQLMQSAVVATWVAGLPVALVPLWQLLQVGEAGAPAGNVG